MVAGTVLVHAAPALGSAEWLAEFLLSPGPAALAAVLAAVVGFGATRARIRADRAAAEKARQDAALRSAVARRGQVEDRDLAQWWSVFCWVTEQDDLDGTVPASGVLEALGGSADDGVRSALVTLALSRGRTSEERCDDA
jgi:hypothetical protein